MLENGGNAMVQDRTDGDSTANECGFAGHLLTTGSVVYFITPIRSRRVKIGYTTDLKERLRKLQATNHVELAVLLTLPGDIGLETRLHQRFKRDRQRNEWFKLSDDIKAFIADNGGRIMPPSGSYSGEAPSDDDVLAMMLAAQRNP